MQPVARSYSTELAVSHCHAGKRYDDVHPESTANAIFRGSYADLADVLGKPTAEGARKAARRALLRRAEEMKVNRRSMGSLISRTCLS